MKKKNLWLAVVTLVLCLGVMATGIYAAKQALLKIGGTLGFNMNNAIVEVSGTISNIAVKDTQTGAFTKTTKTISNAIMGGETQTETKLDLGQLDFYAGEDMIFELTFTNLGSKTIIGVFDIEYSNTKVQKVDSSLYDSLPASKMISANGTTTLTFALTLTDESAVIDGFAFTITAEFDEFEIKTDENDKHYIEMGAYDGQALKWYPIAYSDGGEYQAFDPIDDMESGSYYFISEYCLGTSRYSNSSWGYTTDGEYSLSDLKQYLNDLPLNETYLKFGNTVLYKAIATRNLPGDTYSVASEEFNGQYTSQPTLNQKLWALTSDEFNDFLVGSDFAIGKLISNKTAAKYWLKNVTFCTEYGGYTYGIIIDENGTVYPDPINYTGGTDVSYSDIAVRPVFQFDIA